MNVTTLRFYGIEHVFFMGLAPVIGHIGSAVRKKDIEDHVKFKRSAIFFTLAVVLILMGIPWDRALLPSF